jgi:hypothetical protein
MRLEIFSPDGTKVFDSDFVSSPSLDWFKSDPQGRAVDAGIYSYTLTVKDAAGNEVSRNNGRVPVDSEEGDGKNKTAKLMMTASILDPALDIDGGINLQGIADLAVSPPGQGRLYFDSLSNKFKVSQNGGAYVDLLGSSANPGTITGVTAGTGLTGGGTSGNVTVGIANGGVANLQLAANAVTAPKIAAGQVVKSLNGKFDNVTLVAGSNISITPSGSTLTIAATGGGLALPFSGTISSTSSPFIIANTGSGDGVAGSSFSGSGVRGISTNGNGVLGTSSAAGKAAVAGVHTTGDGIAGFSTSGVGVRGSSGSNNGVYGVSSSNIGVRGDSTSNVGVAGYSTSNHGVYGQSSGSGNGVYGVGANGVYGSSNGSGAGVFGESPNADGVLGKSNSGVGARGVSTSNNGVYGVSSTNVGVRGDSTGSAGVGGYSTNSDGVYGQSSGAGNGVAGVGTNGVYGRSSGGGVGVFGEAVNSYAVFGKNTGSIGIGVYGENNQPDNSSDYGRPIGVKASSYWGYAIFAESVRGYAGILNGNVNIFGDTDLVGNAHVAGTLSKTAGSFKIDHPLDPENKYLYHSFVESPDMKNIYDGVAVLDANGEAAVTLPEWFQALNKDFRYQLTAVGAPGPNLYVAAEITRNQFKIAGGTPEMKVSWQVTGIRKDPYAEKHRIPVEEMKADKERGFYLHPDAYGQSPEKSIQSARNPELMQQRKEQKQPSQERNQ